MKSLGDEIFLAAGNGADLISSEVLRRRFHRALRDFIIQRHYVQCIEERLAT